MIIPKVLFVLASLTICIEFSEEIMDYENNAYIHETNIGKNTILTCQSNDENHVFLFWQIHKNGIVLGPKNKFDQTKYNYEVTTGNLTVRGVTTEDDGLYTCISQGIKQPDYTTSSVKLVVMKDWEEVFETDHDANIFRACAVLSSLLIILLIIYVIMRYRDNFRRDFVQHYDEHIDDDDDSTEELFNREPSTSGHKTIVLEKKTSPDDFEKVYTTISMPERA